MACTQMRVFGGEQPLIHPLPRYVIFFSDNTADYTTMIVLDCAKEKEKNEFSSKKK